MSEEFCIRASNAGIEQAHSRAAMYSILMQEDYTAGARHFKLMYDSYENIGGREIKDILDIVNQYKISTGSLSDEMKKAVAKLIEFGFDISLLDNGWYYWNKARRE